MHQGASISQRVVAILLVGTIVGGAIAYGRSSGADLSSDSSSRQTERPEVSDSTTPPAPQLHQAAASKATPDDDDAAAIEEVTSSAAADEASWDHQPIDKYLTFLTPYSEQVIRNYRLECPHSGRTIRLIDSMRSGIRQVAMMGGAHLHMTVDSRGKEVRVYNQMRSDDGRSNSPHAVMSIDGWGELHTFGINPSSVYAACYG